MLISATADDTRTGKMEVVNHAATGGLTKTQSHVNGVT
jgi:hypothetical protein